MVDTALKALAEPTRRRIISLVWDAELTAGEIASHFSVTRPAVSQHLGVLKEAELVSERREGTKRLYRARPEQLDAVRRALESFWDTGLPRLKHAAEKHERAQRRSPKTKGR